jgi:Site-specific recombinase XerD
MQNNRSTFSILFYLNTSKAKKSGKCPIVGRITVDGKSKAFATGLDILPEYWDVKAGLAIGKSEEIKSINSQIEKYRTDITGYYKILVNDNGYVTAETLKNALLGSLEQNTLMQEFALLVEEKRQAVGILIALHTYKNHCNAYRHLKEFMQEKYGVTDVPFARIDFSFVEAYIYYLKINLRLLPRTVKQTVAPFRKVVKRAFNKGMIQQDPFFDYRPERPAVKRRWLLMDELERLMNVQMERDTANFIKDMFLFSTFTGLAYTDLKNLRHEDIRTVKDGNLCIILDRQKTGTASYIPLLDIPKQIMEKYRNTEFAGTDGKVFKIRTIENANIQLKKIAKAAGIDKRLTHHMSRHCFATQICLSQGVPIETLSRMMGHRDITTTQIYAKITRAKIKEDMTNLAERIEGKYTLV